MDVDERMKCNVARLQNVESQLRAAGDGNYMAEVCACYIGVNRPTFASLPAFFALFLYKNSLKIAIIFLATNMFCVQQLCKNTHGAQIMAATLAIK